MVLSNPLKTLPFNQYTLANINSLLMTDIYHLISIS